MESVHRAVDRRDTKTLKASKPEVDKRKGCSLSAWLRAFSPLEISARGQD
jgi:hypothetical protein